MKLTICEFTGNFVAGASDDTTNGIDLEQSICNYKTEVKNLFTSYYPGTEIVWDIRNGEGDPSRYHCIEFNATDDEDRDIIFEMDAVRERVFSQGTFWANAIGK